jgi:hypothetical protein
LATGWTEPGPFLHPPLPHSRAPARFGWYGFNTGSTYLWGPPSPVAAQRAAMNTTLGASSSGLVALLLGSWISGTYDLRLCCNGVLSGLVTVTAMCGFVDPYAAAVCGIIAGVTYIGFSRLMVGYQGWGRQRRWQLSVAAGCSRSQPQHLLTFFLSLSLPLLPAAPAACRHRRSARQRRGALWQRAAGHADACALCQAGPCAGACKLALWRHLLHAYGLAAAGHAGVRCVAQLGVRQCGAG